MLWLDAPRAGLGVSNRRRGNIMGRRGGSDSTLKPLVMGSHIDSVPEGGNFDGDVGSLSAIEVAQTLMEHKLTIRHSLEVIIFADEEGGTIGSHASAARSLTSNSTSLVTAARRFATESSS